MADSDRIQGNKADFCFKVGELTFHDLRVTGFTGSEGLSQLFDFRVELCSENREVDFASVLGKPCTLEIEGGGGTRYVNGIVRRFARTREGAKLTHYSAEVAPKHWLLTKRYKSRIYQSHNCSDMSVPGIIKQVFKDAGLPDDYLRFALTRDYQPREVCVQYRETDFDFISRLMEHEGIFYFFEHTFEGHKMVFGDSPVAHAVNPVGDEFPYREPNALVPDKEFVFSLLDQEGIETGATCLEDFNFRKPTLELRASVSAGQYTDLEFSDYPGEYDDKAVGDQYAQVRLEEFQADKRVLRLSTRIRTLYPGFKFTLKDHPADAVNREYLVTHIAHRASQPQAAREEAAGDGGCKHETDIRCIPSDVSFRAPRRTRRPIVLGSQTALVAGPSGEEIYTDDDGYGRVKVQFHWDRDGKHDENSSCWIRVSSGLAGGQYGMLFLPRVGQEVIVDFLEGNPDRPIVTGRVYNNDNMPPYPLPDEKTKSTIKTRSSKGGDGFNEIRFEDKKGDEQLFVHAERDVDWRVKRDQRNTIMRDMHDTVERDSHRQIKRDENHIVDGNQLVKIGGTRSHKVMTESLTATNYNLTVDAAANEICNGNRVIQVGGVLSIKASTIILDAATVITLTAGGSGVVAVTPAAVATGPLTSVCMGPGVVAPVPASGVAPPGVPGLPAVAGAPAQAPKEPEPAATGDPGKDYAYKQEPKPLDPMDDAKVHKEEETPEQKHWIGVRLWDDNGKPLCGERYYVTLPNGTTIARGFTNENGEVEIKGIDPGSCQVTFPDLDGATWDVGPAGASTASAGGGGGAGAPGGNGMPSAGGLPSAPSLPV